MAGRAAGRRSRSRSCSELVDLGGTGVIEPQETSNVSPNGDESNAWPESHRTMPAARTCMNRAQPCMARHLAGTSQAWRRNCVRCAAQCLWQALAGGAQGAYLRRSGAVGIAARQIARPGAIAQSLDGLLACGRYCHYGASHTKSIAAAHPVSVDFLRLLSLNGRVRLSARPAARLSTCD